MDIAKRIKAIREAKGLRQLDIASKLGIKQTNYGRFEKRGNKLTIEQLEQIATALNVTIKEILFDEPPSNNNSNDLELQKTRVELAKTAGELQAKQQEVAFLQAHTNKLLAIIEKMSK